MVLAISGCGGGGGAETSSESLPFVSPAAGMVLIYSIANVDNSANTINTAVRETYSAHAADGSYAVQIDEQSSRVIINGVAYGGFSYAEQRNASGQLTTRALVSGGSAYSCAFNPPETVVPYPLTTGSTWDTSSTASCTDGRTLSYGFAGGHVVGIEDITTPVGAFHTWHVAYTVHLGSSAVAYIENIQIDLWIDAKTGAEVQIDHAYTYTGGQPSTGYLTSTRWQLAAAQWGT